MTLRASPFAWLLVLAVAGVCPVGCASLAPDPIERLRPIVWAADSEVLLVRCRWPDGARVRVAIPPDSEPLSAAVRAWNRTSLPIRLVESPADGEFQIALHLVEKLEGDDGRGRKGEARVDCMRTAEGRFVLHAAEVLVARNRRDPLGRPMPHTEEELAGTALHELGHALGFAGHVPGAGSEPMDGAAEVLRRLGRRALRGDPIDSRAMEALYARPSGSILARSRVDAWRTRQIDELAARARLASWEGPLMRVGDSGASLFWRTPAGTLGFRLANPEATLTDPSQALFVPDAHARSELAEPGPTGGGSRLPGRSPGP